MRDTNKSKRWQARMPFTQAMTVERALRDLKADSSPSYKLLTGDKSVMRRAVAAVKSRAFVQRLLRKLDKGVA